MSAQGLQTAKYGDTYGILSIANDPTSPTTGAVQSGTYNQICYCQYCGCWGGCGTDKYYPDTTTLVTLSGITGCACFKPTGGESYTTWLTFDIDGTYCLPNVNSTPPDYVGNPGCFYGLTITPTSAQLNLELWSGNPEATSDTVCTTPLPGPETFVYTPPDTYTPVYGPPWTDLTFTIKVKVDRYTGAVTGEVAYGYTSYVGGANQGADLFSGTSDGTGSCADGFVISNVFTDCNPTTTYATNFNQNAAYGGTMTVIPNGC